VLRVVSGLSLRQAGCSPNRHTTDAGGLCHGFMGHSGEVKVPLSLPLGHSPSLIRHSRILAELVPKRRAVKRGSAVTGYSSD
jgi:hypothetical protein